MEAFFSLLAAFLLLSLIPFTYNAQSFSRASLIQYQHANDVAEVLWAAGDYERVGDWIEGSGGGGGVIRGRLKEIAEEMDACIVLEAEGKKMDVNCEGNEKDVTSITRVIVGESGIHSLRIRIS